MMLCKDCMHYEVCKDYVESALDGLQYNDSQMNGDDCEFFKDRSRFVELPFEFISKKDLIRELSAQCAVNKIDLETAHDMIKHLPYFRTEAERIDVARDNLAEAVRVVSAAAKYRIPQKPEKSNCYWATSKTKMCPTCKCMVLCGTPRFCTCCGQALDWSEKNERI